MSETEPELGLGTVVQALTEHVEIQFSASSEFRRYALDHAPLQRVRFQPGDVVTSRSGQRFEVTGVREEDGLLVYLGERGELPESQLCDTTSLRGAEDRLQRGLFDDLPTYALRCQALRYRHHQRQSPVRGFVGARIDLIPHQLYIAHEVGSRHAPRVLLSDEVGLGKTIEACLIVHRLLLSGRASRVLLLVPEPLVNQWFVEMLRRFNLSLAIFDEERCAAIETGHPEANPFLDDQFILCSLDFLASSPRRAAQALAATWDILVVDEAHHLGWTPELASPQYLLVESLSRQAEGLLLLTATPEQLGLESHFARLRLLDPDRYVDFTEFTREPADYRALAGFVELLQSDAPIPAGRREALKHLLPKEAVEIDTRLAAIDRNDPAARQSLTDDLLDLHGPGRGIFRNTRAAMTGFPQRKAHLAPLLAEDRHDVWVDRLSTEFAVDAGDRNLRTDFHLPKDPRVLWLVLLLRSLDPEKVLLICRSPAKVLALETALRQHLQISATVFHEGLSLIQRDRNAAWFAEEEGARLLLCSEIGSEGRNFQFAHHLVLFDLPLNPELLEQRIGRLDRIGQTADIHLHVPYLQGSPQEVLARWYHDGLDAFEHFLEGGNELLREFGVPVRDLALEFPALDPAEAKAKLRALIRASSRSRQALRQRLEQGRDRLLERNSFRPHTAQRLVEDIRREDRHAYLETFMLDVWDHFGVHIEELAARTYGLNPRGVTTDAFPAIPDEGMTATFDRIRALGREDVGFLSWDHPMVSGVLDLLLGSERGNCAFGIWPAPDERTLLLESWFVLETVAARRLHVDRFLPATPIRIVINHKAAEITAHCPLATLQQEVRAAQPYRLIDDPKIQTSVLPAMLQAAKRSAEEHARGIVAHSQAAMDQLLTHEIRRLVHLQSLHGHIRSEELELARKEQTELANALKHARVRLDALRLIWKGPEQLLR